MKTKQLLHYIFIVLLTAGLLACSDNGSGPGDNDNEAPSIPDLTTKTVPEVSFFQQNTAPSGSVNFSNATFFATTNGTLLANSLFQAFLAPGFQAEPDFIDGEFVWEYSGSLSSGESVSLRTTARPQDNGFEWRTFLSFDDGQGNSLDNALVLRGTTSNDCAQGTFTFSLPTPESESGVTDLYTSSFTITSETERSFEATLFGFEGETVATVSFQLNGNENLLVIDFADEDTQDAEVFWNSESGIGYFMQGDERGCWDGSFADTTCSEVGL